jgi:hypothetical protein
MFSDSSSSFSCRQRDLLLGDQLERQFLNLLDLHGRCEPLLAGLGHACADLLPQAGIADHLELIEIARRDRQEAEAFEQRVVRIGRLFEHAPIEFQPGKLPVQEPVQATPSFVSPSLAAPSAMEIPSVSGPGYVSWIGGSSGAASPMASNTSFASGTEGARPVVVTP